MRIRSKKNIAVIVLAVIICLILAGVGVNDYQARQAERNATYAFSDGIEIGFTNAAEVVDAIRENLREHAISVTVGYHAAGDYMDDARAMVDELMGYAMEPTADPTEGDYIRYQYGGYQLTYSRDEQESGQAYRLKITPTYYTDLEQELEVDEAVEEILRDMGFTWFTSDADKVEAIYQYLVNHVQYDTVRKNHRGYHLKTTAYAALVQESAVCQGYCVAAYRLLREAGVECRIVTGYAEYEGASEYHAWNLVRLGDVWYNLDTTWDSYLGTNQYYLKCDASFTDHTRDPEFATAAFYERYPMAEEDYVRQ